MRRILLPILLTLTVSCSTTKLAVPEQFSSQSTRFPVKGVQGWMVNQHLRFGDYSTSRIKRGWNISSSVRYNNNWTPPEEVLRNIFAVEMMQEHNKEKNRFRYTLTNPYNSAEIFGTEVFNKHDLVFSNSRILKWGEYTTTIDFKYAFTAAIIPNDTGKLGGMWSLLMTSNYDISRDTSRRLFDRYVEEEGYATNGRDTIRIRSLNLNSYVKKNGEVGKTLLGIKMFSGYELSTTDGVIGIIDIMDKALWIYNEQDDRLKFILSAMGSAILLKQIENPETKTTI